jgi:outer membrane protein OmpA-like peptidoglycan-associated protein
MKKLFILILLVLFTVPLSFAQSKVDKTKFGIQGNGLLVANEFKMERSIKTSWLARGLVRFGLGEYFNAEVGAGYGQYAGLATLRDYYKSIMVPVDFRLFIKFVEHDTYPYLFLGVGGMYYKVDNFPEHTNPNGNFPNEVKDKGFAGIAPVGLGYNIDLGSGVALDLNVGVTLTTTDNLNYYKGGNPTDADYRLGLGLLFGSSVHDDDMDGLMSDVEKQLGTDPLKADTDGDGLNDGEEVNRYKTDPLKTDTDSDGLNDGEEVLKYKTDPLKADTDGDGLNDGEEVNKYKTDPLKADTDGDGLGDSDEVMKYKTDPLKSDTDADGLSDGDEVMKYKTDPVKADTDGDGLKDGDEVMKYKTDPLKTDTDGGTVDDGAEVKRGTDPLNADDDVVKVGVPIVLEGITFETGKSEITPESEQILMGAHKTLMTYSDISVEISGHTDNVGSKESNIRLSQRRADAVKDWLVAKGINAERITAIGYGPDEPRVPNTTAENKRQNRRIEFKRTK